MNNINLFIIHKCRTKKKLLLNIKKTVSISFGNYYDSVSNQINIKINDKEINRVESC